MLDDVYGYYFVELDPWLTGRVVARIVAQHVCALTGDLSSLMLLDEKYTNKQANPHAKAAHELLILSIIFK